MKDLTNTLSRTSLGTPILVLMMLAMMVLPLPPFLLDILFTFNISLALVVLLACVYTQRPLNFSVFPTLLLLTTLLRLTLNVASTRIVLLNGHTGTHAAGQVVQSFGSVVIGSNTVVGLVVFTILVIINFIVVTKGAGRVSEVTARFTLDAMPGKQMAVDADLNAGLISQDVARNRREEIAHEADFYGAMDGASKFVRGDAIAGILILLINIIGGLSIGILQHNMPIHHAIHNYTLLTIGDGLVAQVPALLLSTATAIIVTRATRAQDMGTQVLSQLFNNPQALGITAIVIGVFGLIPGMPHLAFLSLAALATGGMLWLQRQAQRQTPEWVPTEGNAAAAAIAPTTQEVTWSDVTPLDQIGIEVGYRLIKLIKNGDSKLMTRIKGVRKTLSQDLGFLIPPVHIRDNLELSANRYQIQFNGVTYGDAEIYPNKRLAIHPGPNPVPIDGITIKDPTFGLDAVWIHPEQLDQAQQAGYTVIDPETVLATHLSHLIQRHAAELLGHEEVQSLLDRLASTAPKLVDALIPNTLSLSGFVKVLRQLLAERIPILDLHTIASSLIDASDSANTTEAYTAAVRLALRRLILQRLCGSSPTISVVTLDRELEQRIEHASTTHSGISIEPDSTQMLFNVLLEHQRQHKPAILLCSDAIRYRMAQFLRHNLPDVHVLSYAEIPDDKQVTIIQTVHDHIGTPLA